jgi:hypothetical protein
LLHRGGEVITECIVCISIIRVGKALARIVYCLIKGVFGNKECRIEVWSQGFYINCDLDILLKLARLEEIELNSFFRCPIALLIAYPALELH